MSSEQRQMIMDLRDPPTPGDNDWEMLDGVFYGEEALHISHAGGEFDGLTDLRDDVRKMYVIPFLLINIGTYKHIFLKVRSIIQITRLTTTALKTGRNSLNCSLSPSPKLTWHGAMRWHTTHLTVLTFL